MLSYYKHICISIQIKAYRKDARFNGRQCFEDVNNNAKQFDALKLQLNCFPIRLYVGTMYTFFINKNWNSYAVRLPWQILFTKCALYSRFACKFLSLTNMNLFRFDSNSRWNNLFVWCDVCGIIDGIQWRQRLYILDFVLNVRHDTLFWWVNSSWFDNRKF